MSRVYFPRSKTAKQLLCTDINLKQRSGKQHTKCPCVPLSLSETQKADPHLVDDASDGGPRLSGTGDFAPDL